MMRILLILGALMTNALAVEIQGERKFNDFKEAQNANEIRWTVESTKVGLFSSDVDGYVLNYSYSADFDEENLILRDLKLTFPIQAMNSDNSSRDDKLHHLCLGLNEFKNIVVYIQGPIFLNDKRQRTYAGTARIRGQDKPFTIAIQNTLEDTTNTLRGESEWSLKSMEIPDPSIAVAKLSDHIQLNINIKHNLK